MRLFESSLHARLYAQFRPEPPKSLINRVIQFVKAGAPLDRAVDVGCGSGQNTRLLAQHFSSVVATDISPAQISEARANNTSDRIDYRESTGEVIPVDDSSIHLVTACQCCHFFDLPRFFAEADRVLAPGGVLAFYGYDMPEPYRRDGQPWKELRDVVQEACQAVHWSHTRQEVADKYIDPRFRLPYPGEIREEDHYVESEITVDQVLGEMRSWSGFQTLVRDCGEEQGEAVISKARDGFVAELSKDGKEVDTSKATITQRFYYFLLMARKPAAS